MLALVAIDGSSRPPPIIERCSRSRELAQVYLTAAVHLALDQLEFGDLPLCLTVSTCARH